MALALEIEVAPEACRSGQGKTRRIKLQIKEQQEVQNNVKGFMKSLQDLLDNFYKERDRADFTMYRTRIPIHCWNCAVKRYLRNKYLGIKIRKSPTI